MPSVRLVHGARRAAGARATLAALLAADFAPEREVVLEAGRDPLRSVSTGLGAGEALPPLLVAGSPGRGVARLLADEADRLEAMVQGSRPGWLVVARAWQPHWRARVGAHAAEVLPADLQRLAIAVPAGEHRVVLWADRGPLDAALGVAALAALALAGLAWRRPAGADGVTAAR
jgi:hypothetical protein